MNLWFQFVICATVITYCGSRLVSHGDVIAAKTGLGKGWVGLVLLATITSLPELVSAVSAVTITDLPDMAVSSTIGSCMFNMFVIALLDLTSRKKPVSLLVHDGHILSAGFGIILMGFAAIDILFGKHLPILEKLNKIDPLTLAYPVVYLIAMKLIFSFERTRIKEFVGQGTGKVVQEEQSLKLAIALFTLNSIMIVAAACYLPELGARIAKVTGWGESFIGTSFIAVTTSLPEVAVSFTAARRGYFDMAVANLLGSNLFNIVILSIADFCYLKGPLLRSVSPVNTLAALAAMISMAIVVVGLTYKSEKKLLFLAGDAVAIMLVFLLTNVLLFVIH
jgi:cation:H+ antiporter